MGDVSIIARRLADGKGVQYGWSGNGGYYITVGSRLLEWYSTPDSVDYLFSLGQLRNIGYPHSEINGDFSFFTTAPTGEPHWSGQSEREIFSQIAFIDYGYFYDTDNTWYYVIPGPFRIKIPLQYIDENTDEQGYEFDERQRIEKLVISYILQDYYQECAEFRELVQNDYNIKEVRETVLNASDPIECFFESYKTLFKYFDDWVVVIPSIDNSSIDRIIVRKSDGDAHLETINWCNKEQPEESPDKEEVFSWSEELLILDRNTAKYMLKDLQEQLAAAEAKIAEMNAIIARKNAEIDQNKEMDEGITSKAATIAMLQEKLKEYEKNAK